MELWARSIPGLILAVSALAAPAITPRGIVNNASYSYVGLPNSSIALGSLFAIFGTELGPAVLEQVRAFPLRTEFGGTSVRVTMADGATVDALVVYTSAGQVGAILPSNTPTGSGRVVVTYRGQPSPPEPVTIVRNSPGIFARNEQGSGAAAAQHINTPGLPVNALNQVARPGEVIDLWVTGLGPVVGNEAAGPLPFVPIGVDQVEVYVGGRRAETTYIGRSGCCAGLDQVRFRVPAGVEGCYVPVAVRAGGVTSNFTTISVAASGSYCADATGFTRAEVERLLTAGSVVVGVADLKKVTVKLSQGVNNTDSGSGGFLRYDATRLVASAHWFVGPPPPGSCNVTLYRGVGGSTADALRFDALDAGVALNLSGPRGESAIGRQPDLTYSGKLGGGPQLPGDPPPEEYLLPGAYSVNNGAGGAGVGVLRASMTLPSGFTWSNQDSINLVPRAQDLTITWSGGDPSREYVTVTGESARGTGTNTVGAVFRCIERASAGRITVPSLVLSVLPATAQPVGTGVGTLAVSASPARETVFFNAAGINAGYFLYTLQHTKDVNYQ